MRTDTAPVVVNFAPTGVVPTRAATPHVPIEPAEIVEQVHEACEIGITIVHLHARKNGEPVADAAIFAEIISGIRKHCPELVICVSLSGRRISDARQRAAVLTLEGDLKPDMASLTLSSLNFARESSRNSPDDVQFLARRMLETGVVPELEAFDVGMINYAHYLIGKGLLRAPFYFNLILGNIASAQCDLLHAGLLTHELPPDSIWAFGGIGRDQLPAAVLALATGGGVRIGLEDNLFLDRSRQVLATNRQLLERVHVLARMFERPVMISTEFRQRLGLRSAAGGYGRVPVSVQAP